MSLLAIVLAVATADQPPICVPTQEAREILKFTEERPTPRGMIIGSGSDWGAKFLVVRTTHRLAGFGVPPTEGTETVTYITTWRERTCSKKLEKRSCPTLEGALRTLRARSYGVMYNRDGLVPHGADHPPFALLHAQDGDGNTTKIVSTHSDHPLLNDVSYAFSDLKSCTKDADELSGGL
jgi:hypothetical protein